MKKCGITIYELKKKINKGFKFIFFGAGITLSNMYNKYPELVKATEYIVDNSKAKIGTDYVGNLGYKIPIFSPEELGKSFCRKKHVIIFSLNDYEKAYEQTCKILETSRFRYYITPILRLECSYFYWKRMDVIRKICSLLPIRNAILFLGWGESQRENESALMEYLLNNGYGNKYKIIWQSDDFGHDETKVKTITKAVLERKTTFKEIWKYYYAHLTSKYLVWENHDALLHRKGQILVYLNHGTPPIKETKKTIVITPAVTYACCPSENVKEIVAEQYSINKNKLLITGSPRFDHLYEKERVVDDFVKGDFDKIILWVPTFRQHNILRGRIDSKCVFPYGIPVISDQNDFDMINDYLRKNRVALLIKPHPLQDLSVLHVTETSNIFLLEQEELDKKGIGVNYILKDVDAMITDYSTIAFDFMLLDRMIAYTIDDMEDYSIGFATENPLQFMPGKYIKTIDEFLEFIKDVVMEKDDYSIERNILKDKIHKYQDADNCRRLVEMLDM